MSHFSKAIDEVRAAQARRLAAEGKAPGLKRSENLTDTQSERVRCNLRTVRASLLKEDFQALWEYVSPYWAGRFRPSSPQSGDRRCTRTMRSRLDPMKKVARMMRTHRELILSWFRTRGALSKWKGSTARRE